MTDLARPAADPTTLQLEANSLPQLFEKAAVALLNTLIDHETVGEALREKVVVEGEDAAGLLKAWVDTLLRLANDHYILYKKSRFQEFEAERQGPGRLRAEITGELIDPQRHSFRIDPAQLRCERVDLLNGPKTLEAQIILTSEKIKLA